MLYTSWHCCFSFVCLSHVWHWSLMSWRGEELTFPSHVGVRQCYVAHGRDDLFLTEKLTCHSFWLRWGLSPSGGMYSSHLSLCLTAALHLTGLQCLAYGQQLYLLGKHNAEDDKLIISSHRGGGMEFSVVVVSFVQDVLTQDRRGQRKKKKKLPS